MIRDHTALRRIVALVLITAAAGCAFLALRGDDAPAATTNAKRLVNATLVAAAGSPTDRRRGRRAAPAVAARRRARRRSELRGGARRAPGTSRRTPRTSPSRRRRREAPHRLGRDEQRWGRSSSTRRRSCAPSDPANGTVDRLWLVGAGDPSLSTPDYPGMVDSNPLRNTEEQATGPSKSATSLGTLADAIAAAGVRNIPGGIQGDDSRYEAVRYVPSWPATLPHRPRDRAGRRAHREPRDERHPTEAHAGGRSGGVRGDAARRPAPRAAACRSARPGGRPPRRAPSRLRRSSRRRCTTSWPPRSSPVTTSRWRCSSGRSASRSRSRARPPPAPKPSSTRCTSSGCRWTASRSSTGRASTAAIACRARR